jgi:hypothetical protein
MIVNIDENIGRLRQGITDLGLADNTIVAFLTDNGGTVGVRLYNAGMRAGIQTNGFWDLEVARDGVYRISLRRWPEEADVEIGAIVKPVDLDPAKIDVNARLYQMPSGAIRATRARLKIGDFDETRPVKPSDKVVTFLTELEAGRANLQTWLIDDGGASWGAYYVYIGHESIVTTKTQAAEP